MEKCLTATKPKRFQREWSIDFRKKLNGDSERIEQWSRISMMIYTHKRSIPYSFFSSFSSESGYIISPLESTGHLVASRRGNIVSFLFYQQNSWGILLYFFLWLMAKATSWHDAPTNPIPPKHKSKYSSRHFGRISMRNLSIGRCSCCCCCPPAYLTP